MKFDNFLKYAAGDGAILEAENGDKWLFYANVGMKIPNGKNVCGNVSVMPEAINDLIEYDDYVPCELKSAYVPNADSKPSELIRRFERCGADEDNNLFIDVPNKIFGFIERKDETFINEIVTDEYRYVALLVTDDYGDDREFKMIYIEKD